MIELNKFYVGESVTFMRDNIEDNYVDLTVTSPPYDDLRKYNGFIFDYKAMFNELYRVTKDGGIVVWIVGDKTEKGTESLSSFKHALFAKEIGFNMHDTMIWEKTNPIPQDPKSNRYTPSFEYMFVFSKGKPKTCNYLKEKSICGGKEIKNNKSQRRPDGASRDDRLEKRNGTTVNEFKIRTNIWKKSSLPRNEHLGHPAQFPEQLVLDHILSWSNEGDIVFDPMCGSGTTCKMAWLNKRNFIGIDMSEEYINNICIPRLNTYGWLENKYNNIESR